MTDLSWLNASEAGLLFGPEGQHVPVVLQRLKSARLLWLDRKAAISDPTYAELGSDMESYESKLLETCAYAVPVSGDQFDPTDQIVAYADRYGGLGIGDNGGSGRAAVIGSYLVKGVGRTSLISAGTDSNHASGGAYLEEAVRETIYCEVVRAEHPHSAVPVLAIIDTGIEHDFGFKIERRVLLVRPCFIRPAHYLRAITYMSGNPTEGALDHARVKHMFRQTVELIGKQEFIDRYSTLWINWAAQLAYGFIHRLVHGSYSESNICFDGKMLDFGATSAVPSWGDAALMLFRQTFKNLQWLSQNVMHSNSYFFGRHLDPDLDDAAVIKELRDRITHTFRTTVVVEMLRLAGLHRDMADSAALDEQWWPLAQKLIGHYQREQLEMADGAPKSFLPWDFDKLWQTDVPPHLKPLRDAIDGLIPPGQRALAARRCSLLATSRPGLYREEVKHEIYQKIDPSMTGQEVERNKIENFILMRVAENRRDSRVSAAEAVCVGFALNNGVSYAIFQHADGSLFAIDEHEPSARFTVARLTPGSMHFRDAGRSAFRGNVVVDGALMGNDVCEVLQT